jgi:hypothetical protein
MTNTIPLRQDDLPERMVHTWQHIFDSGLLWYINRSLFHPLGYALGIEHSGAGWSLHYAGEPVSFGDDTDEDAKFKALNELLAAAREHGVTPPNGVTVFQVEARVEREAGGEVS